MNLSIEEDNDPYHIFNIYASSATETIASCIENVSLPSESVYYAAEYVRLQSEIDSWKEKATNLKTQLNEKTFEKQIQSTVIKETTLQLQEKFNSDKQKLVNFYETRIYSLSQKNRDLEKKNNGYLKSIEVLNEQLKLANLNVSKTTGDNSTLKTYLETQVNEVKKLKTSEKRLQKALKDFLPQVLSQERFPNTHIKGLSKNQVVKKSNISTERRTSNTFTRQPNNCQNYSINHPAQIDNSYETSNSQMLADDHQSAEGHGTTYPPMSSHVTPVTIVSSLETDSHYQVSCTLSHEPNSQNYICSCGKKYSALGCLQLHIHQKKNGKVYSCRICKKRFAGHITLKNHYLNVHGIEYEFGKYGCGYCGQTFSTTQLLRQHKTVEHRKGK